MMDRRSFIAAASATVATAATGAGALAAPYDPLPEMVAEWKRRYAISEVAETDDGIDAWCDSALEIESVICTTPATTREGILAQAEVLRHEINMEREVLGKCVEPIIETFFDGLVEVLTS